MDLLGSDNRARNSPSQFNGITEAEDDSLIQRRTYFPHSWLWDMEIKTGFAPCKQFYRKSQILNLLL